MNAETFFHYLSLSISVICAITLIAYILYKKCNIIQKINASVYIVLLGVYSLFSEFLLNFVHNYYNAYLSYNYTISSILACFSLICVLIVLVGLFFKNNKFQKYGYIIAKIGMFVLSAAIIWSLATSKFNNSFIIPLILLNLIFVEHFLINTTEDLETKSSKVAYFTVNSIIAVFWVVCIIALCIKNSFYINIELALLAILFLLISFCSLVTGLLKLKGKKI